MTHAVGQIIGGRYEVRSVLKPGGQGEVYLVFDHNERIEGVLKLIDTTVLPPGASAWDEARVLRRLTDDHILPIYNADSIAGQPFIVTELARHGTLDDQLAATRGLGLSVDDVVTWIRQACVGVARAHDEFLVHNDIKPANLFLNDNAECLVGDFGLASLVPALPLIGVARGATAETAAPEVAATWSTGSPPASFQTDVYSLGATAYWLLSGRSPVDLTGIAPMAARMASAAAQTPMRLRDVAPHIPASVANIVETAMSADLTRRYGSVHELDAALGSRPTRSRRWWRTDEHTEHLGCWRGEQIGRSTYVLCLEHGARPNTCSVTTRHETGARVPGGSRSDRIKNWPVAVRATMDRLS